MYILDGRSDSTAADRRGNIAGTLPAFFHFLFDVTTLRYLIPRRDKYTNDVTNGTNGAGVRFHQGRGGRGGGGGGEGRGRDGGRVAREFGGGGDGGVDEGGDGGGG